MYIKLISGDEELPAFMQENRAIAQREHYGMVSYSDRPGRQRHVVICGSGPSLGSRETHQLLRHHRGHVWACNWSLQYLVQEGFRVTHGVAVDSSLGMLQDWPQAYAVEYLLATSVHPDLVRHLHGRPITFFHNYRDLPEQDQLYGEWPPSVQVGFGLTVVTRAICLAIWMGYRRITVVGTDCALGPWDIVRPNGQSVKEAYGSEKPVGEILLHGRTWRSVGDYFFDAVALCDLAKEYPKVRLHGDTLPNAMRHVSKSQRDRFAYFAGPGELVINATFGLRYDPLLRVKYG